jgi:cardiolipin synthase
MSLPGINLILLIVYHLIVVMVIIRVLMENRQPSRTAAWALVIWFVPIVGIVLFFLFGTNTRRERMVSQRSMDQLTKRSMLGFVEQHDLHLPQQQRTLINLFINQSMSLPFRDTAVTAYTDGYQFFPALMAAIATAKSHIHISIYIIEDDALGQLISDCLISKARQGVEVRLVYDDVGCWNVKSRFFERMREEGIEVAPFLPVRFPSFTSKVNYRNHRKLIVIDGTTGFIGGMNIALRYVKGVPSKKSGGKKAKDDERECWEPWRDTMLRVTGSAVYSLQRAFLIDWYFVDNTLLSDRKYYPASTLNPPPSTLHLQPSALSPQPSTTVAQTVTSGPVAPYPEIMLGFVQVIQTARQYVYMETPYFLPTEPVLFALKSAAAAGVDVRLLVPLRCDSWIVDWASRSYLREVQEAGVRVSFYTAGFLHSKFMVSDDSVSTCGSTNIDFRSFENNFEANMFFYGSDTAMLLKRIFIADETTAMPLESMPRRLHPRFFGRLAESLFRLLAPLM